MKVKNLSLLLFLFTILSCSKDYEVKQKQKFSLTNPNHVNTETKPKFKLIVRIGTYLFPNCEGSNYCGPCAGICIRRVPNIADAGYELSNSEIEYGDRIIDFQGLNNSTAQIEFDPNENYFNLNDSIYFEDDFVFPESIANSLGYNNLKILGGGYFVNTSNTSLSSAIISIDAN